MFKPLSLFIGLRYVRAKKRNHFVSFIAFSSMLGIALGVTVLITVLSVMNGFDDEIHKRFFGMAPEVTVSNWKGKIDKWQDLEQRLKKMEGVKASGPYVSGQGLVSHYGQVLPVLLMGIEPLAEQKVSQLKDKLVIGNLNGLKDFKIILGQNLAQKLGVTMGDKVTIMIPQATVTPAGIAPRFKRFVVGGVFSAGPGFNFDSQIAFINLHDAQKLMQLGEGVSGIKLKLDDVYKAPLLSDQILSELGESYDVGNWTQQLGAFFQAVKMEKTMMFLILMLIIAVAAFNLVSSLVMVVNDKQAEIAILRTIGATPKKILWIFIVQGMMIGFIGTLLGLIGGIIVASNATAIVNSVQSFFNVQLMSSNVYFVDYLPSKIEWVDLGQVCGIALLMSFLATLYPAWRASKTLIVEALQYE